MGQKPGKNREDFDDEEWDDEEYSDMEMLEMLESIREDMEELGITTLQEVIERIKELNKRLDAR